MTTKHRSTRVSPSAIPAIRCAIYTRKSSDEGLDQQFNSLDAQRESAEAYIASQAGQGWVCLPHRYDDGGISGGTMDRPGLTRLLADIRAGQIDAVVIYKLDRLTRSIRDFGKIMEVFEAHKVALVAVTQSLNTSTSMGRLMLHVLLSFAQFERELASERTRDKIAAARRKGMWSGGRPVLGYDLSKCKLTVNEEEAIRVREIFSLYIRLQSLEETAAELNRRGWTTKRWLSAGGVWQGGRSFDKSALHHMLTNVVYTGRVQHRGDVFDGEHEAIVEKEVWDRVQSLLRVNGRSGGSYIRNRYGALLKGLLHCAACGEAMAHTYAVKNRTTVYRYYTCGQPKAGRAGRKCSRVSIPADQIERFITDQIRELGKDPELVTMVLDTLRAQSEHRRADLDAEARTIARERAWLEQRRASAGTNLAAIAEIDTQIRICDQKGQAVSRELALLGTTGLTRDRVGSGMASFDLLWESLSPAEKASILRLVLAQVTHDSTAGTVRITLRGAHNRTDTHEEAA